MCDLCCDTSMRHCLVNNMHPGNDKRVCSLNIFVPCCVHTSCRSSTKGTSMGGREAHHVLFFTHKSLLPTHCRHMVHCLQQRLEPLVVVCTAVQAAWVDSCRQTRVARTMEGHLARVGLITSCVRTLLDLAVGRLLARMGPHAGGQAASIGSHELTILHFTGERLLA